MTALHLIRLRVHTPPLMRFARDQNLLGERDDSFGYLLHAWLAAAFGTTAPKPFRFDARRSELLGYGVHPARDMMAHAATFAMPQTTAVLVSESLASKPMPVQWPEGKRLQLHVEACPVSRKDDEEKDVYLRALDRAGNNAPNRSEVYQAWLRRQIEPAVHVERIEITGLIQRHRLLRPDRRGAERRLRVVERPSVTFLAEVRIRDSQNFHQLLARGVGRHRAFGFGMVLLAPRS